DDHDVDILSKYLTSKTLNAGGIVCKEGQHASFLCFVTFGELEVLKTIDNKEVCIANINEGGTLGEMALIDGLTRSATVRAIFDTVVLILTRKDFDILLEEYPKIGIKILKGIARGMSFNLRQASAQITAFMTMSQ
ncbi:MAG: cyclic nucleotide-binding domain-containing protein, partial [Gammaproteobacteria bacterium]|nr:cyclic nucleotide-binding domain-containing protein [Gammaproteobacteria bacterium]